MSTIAFIPARGGSQSIKNKNIKALGGRPLIAWVLEELESAKTVDKIVVATESQEIAKTCTDLGLSKLNIFHRSQENATDTASTESVMLEYIASEGLDGDTTFLLVQATSPFTSHSDFDQAIAYYKKNDFDSILSCARIKRFFWDEKGNAINYEHTSRPRRQDFKGSLMENGALYINSVANIIEAQNRLSGKIGIYEMADYTSLELDEPEDWEYAEKLIKRLHPKTLDGASEVKLLLSDVDGVLTDAGMYYSEKGDEQKKFSTYDGLAFALAQEKGIKVGVITSENTDITQRRAEKLKLDFVYQGVKKKLEVVQNLCSELGISMQNVAYIGDDINDLETLAAVGIRACPSNARAEIKSIPNIIHLSTKGGDGALREFVELILQNQ